MLNIKRTRENINLYTISLFVILSILPLFDGGFDTYIPIYILLIIFIVFFIKNNIDKNLINTDFNSPLLWYFLYLLWCGLSFIWSIYYMRTMIELIELILYGSVFYMTLQLDEENNFKVISVVLLIGTLIALLGILEYIFIANRRITSTFTNPNPFATYLLILFLFSWGLALSTDKKATRVSAFIFLLGLLLSGSRAGFLSTIIALPMIYIGSKGRELVEKLIKTLILLIFALITTNIIIFIAPLIQDKMGVSMADFLIRKDSLLGSSFVGRLEFWRVAFDLFKNRTLTGYGLGTYFSAYYLEYGGNQWYSRFAHNHYLQILSETGIIGLILFFIFLVVSFKAIYNKFKSKDYSIYLPGATAAILGFLIHIGAEFSFNFPGVTVIFFWFLAMATKKTDKCLIKLENNRKIKINYRFTNLILIILIALLLYNFTFLSILKYTVKIDQDEDKDKFLTILQLSNKYYPINIFGHELEGDYYYRSFQETSSEEDLIKSIDIHEKALKAAPYNGNLNNKIGKLYLELGDLDKAEDYLKSSIEYGAYDIKKYLDLGLFYFNQNLFKEAEDVLLRALELKDYAIRSSDVNSKGTVLINTTSVHSVLYQIYRDNGQYMKQSEQREYIRELIDEYPFLDEFFNFEKNYQ